MYQQGRFLGNVLRTSWIGLLITNGNIYSWIDDEPFEFRNFIPGEPNGDGGCVYMADLVGEWGDASCNEAWPFVCKKDDSK